MKLSDFENKKLEINCTNNRRVEKRLHKRRLSNNGNIKCSWCGYHKNENNRNKAYGGIVGEGDIKYPSWKLASKNKNQWMGKPINYVSIVSKYTGLTWVEIIFYRNRIKGGSLI